jgi:transcriptional regulator with XRE-family HTH domain
VPIRESASERGARRGRQLRARTSGELDTARRTGGLSFRELARRLGVSPDTVQRALRGEAGSLTIDFAARLAAVVGLQLSVGLYPDGDPVRDRAHLALLGRLQGRVGPRLRWRTEVPVPIAGDHRSGDAVIGGDGFDVLVEAETHLHDVQALERTIAAKQRDLGASRVVLLVADTRHNREVIEHAEELKRRFPISTRACLAALARGREPGGDALVIL